MIEANPYRTPKSNVDAPLEVDENAHKVLRGQKLIIHAILLYILLLGLSAYLVEIAGILMLIPMIMSVVGVVRISTGLKYPVWWRVQLTVFLLVPLFNMITLLSLNSRATSRLRQSGFMVGLLRAG